MALLRIFSMFFLVALLAFTTSPVLATFESKITAVQVNQLCSHSADPKLCINTLNRDPRTLHADYNGVAGIALDYSFSTVKSTLGLLQKIVSQTPAGPAKQRFQSCVGSYTSALQALAAARGAWGAHNVPALHDRALDALFQVENCEDEFEGSVDRNSVVALSKRNEGLISIIVAATQFM